MKREVELVVISDVHLGTFGSRADQLKHYLKSINPKTLVLNGDIIDIWQFRKSYFPKSHIKILKQIMNFTKSETQVVYITGNHDEMLRKFADLTIGNFELCNKKIIELKDGKKAWIFHGDVFDISVQHSKWIAKLGGYGYDFLIMSNVFVNWILEKLGREKYSFSKKIKNSVKKAVSFIDNFEKTASELAIEQNYDYVICGHIHQPQMREVKNHQGKTMYLNSGDWIENLTALEYNDGKWEMYHHKEIKKKKNKNHIEDDDDDIDDENKIKVEYLINELKSKS
ncbi:MAG: UDP-2,3-diacylglucosamine diphosphatase [Flavobacteriales bacterium]|nr:UDP-2,3-diacylglucosamine diphosphatase [Flavobacteriales bacterium]